MKIVSDTGPIIGLAKIGKIILLKNIADEVIIPPMVYKELFGKTGPESNEIDQALNTFIFEDRSSFCLAWTSQPTILRLYISVII